jgi:CRP-like cAMP-binding protein
MSEQNTLPQYTIAAQFDPASFLETAAKGRIIATHPKKQIIFAQGDAADSVFYIKEGKVKVTVVSEHGKEAALQSIICSLMRETHRSPPRPPILFLRFLRHESAQGSATPF